MSDRTANVGQKVTPAVKWPKHFNLGSEASGGEVLGLRRVELREGGGLLLEVRRVPDLVRVPGPREPAPGPLKLT